MKHLGHLLVALVLAAAVGCTGELIPIEPDPIGGGGGGGGGGGPDADLGGGSLARQYFDDDVQPLLLLARPKGACVSCHEGTDPIDGPDFLGATATDHYDLLVANPRLVASDPALSLLVLKGDHDGDAFAPAEVSTINEWILMEAAQ